MTFSVIRSSDENFTHLITTEFHLLRQWGERTGIVLFQKEISDAEEHGAISTRHEFERIMHSYGTLERCEPAMFAWRWPQGFTCPESGHEGYCALKGRRLFQCNACARQTSVTAGTEVCRFQAAAHGLVFGHLSAPQAKNGMTSLALSRQLWISQSSAWLQRLAHAATQTPPMPYRLVELAEAHC